MKLKYYKKKKIGNYITLEIIIIILSIVSSFIIINVLANRFNQVIVPMADSRIRKYITTMINDSTDGILFSKDLFTIQKNVDNEIKMITYDSYEATKLINLITNKIQDKIGNIDNDCQKKRIDEIPMGVIFNNGILRNFGPKIKVNMYVIGDVISELQTEVKPYGINNALVEVRVNVSVHARLILPLISKDITVNNIIPISINIVNGKIPDGYIYSYK